LSVSCHDWALRLFDHLVGAGEQRLRYRKSNFFRSFDVHDKLKLSWLIERNIGGVCAFENLISFNLLSTALNSRLGQPHCSDIGTTASIVCFLTLHMQNRNRVA